MLKGKRAAVLVLRRRAPLRDPVGLQQAIHAGGGRKLVGAQFAGQLKHAQQGMHAPAGVFLSKLEDSVRQFGRQAAASAAVAAVGGLERFQPPKLIQPDPISKRGLGDTGPQRPGNPVGAACLVPQQRRTLPGRKSGNHEVSNQTHTKQSHFFTVFLVHRSLLGPGEIRIRAHVARCLSTLSTDRREIRGRAVNARSCGRKAEEPPVPKPARVPPKATVSGPPTHPAPASPE